MNVGIAGNGHQLFWIFQDNLNFFLPCRLTYFKSTVCPGSCPASYLSRSGIFPFKEHACMY